jgi:hypothetical protein
MEHAGDTTIDGVQVEINGEENILALMPKAGTELPVFCHHGKCLLYGGAGPGPWGCLPGVPPGPHTDSRGLFQVFGFGIAAKPPKKLDSAENCPL